MKKTQINNLHNDWVEIKNECRNTVGKNPTDNQPNSEFKTKLLISEHSPIRLLEIKWRWESIKSWISVHFSRHWLGWDKWISTQRTDRTGVNRDELPQNSLVNMDIKANAQALINVSRYRLCYQASTETREYMEDLKYSIKPYEPELFFVMQRNCIYRCGCPEFQECGYWRNFIKKHPDVDMTNIKDRYEAANKDFLNNYKNK